MDIRLIILIDIDFVHESKKKAPFLLKIFVMKRKFLERLHCVYSRFPHKSCRRKVQGGVFLDPPEGGPQHDLEAIHCKTVPQSQSSPSSTIPSPQKVASVFLRQDTRWAAAKLALTDSLVQGDRI